MDNMSINDGVEGVLFEENGNKNLLISFGGIAQGLGFPLFEFYNSLKGIECDKLFIRDFNQSWYQKGVSEDLNSVSKLTSYLRDKIEVNKYEKVCFIGNSMGGYAALLFGVLLNIDKVVAFAPQTFIDKKHRLLFFDKRWSVELSQVHKNEFKQDEYFDLVHLFKRIDFTTSMDVYFSTKSRLDKIHAKRLSRFNQINLISLKEGGHAVAKIVRESGRLNELLTNLFK